MLQTTSIRRLAFSGNIWPCLKRTLLHACGIFANEFQEDICLDGLKEEIIHVRSIHEANFGEKSLNPLQLRNKIDKFKLDEIFYNVCAALKILCTLPVTVASAERSFSKLKLIKNFLRSTMSQQRLTDLPILSSESEFGRKIDFQTVIRDFPLKKHESNFLKFELSLDLLSICYAGDHRFLFFSLSFEWTSKGVCT